MKKTIMTLMACLLCTLTATAQEACYLIGTDGQKEANKASVTLEKQNDGVFKGEVTFNAEGHEFFIATQLGNWDEPDKVESFCYGPKGDDPIMPGTAQDFNLWKEVGPMKCFHAEQMTMGGGGSAGIEYGKAYTVTVNFTNMTLLVSEKASGDSGEGGESDEDDGTTPAQDLDLTKGKHLTLTLPEAGSLQQRLQNEMSQQEGYDVVDFLTLKGKFGGKDLAYLKKQEGYLSQLQYLDLSEVELVYDDEQYDSYTISDKDGEGIAQGIVNYTTYYYTFSAENKEEAAGSDPFTGTSTHSYVYLRRNDFASGFYGMKYLKQIKLPKTLKGLGESIFENAEVLEKVTFPDAPTYIGDNAFVNTTGGYFPELRRTLKGVDLPASITKLGTNALRGVGFRTIDLSQFTELGEGCLSETNITEVKLNAEVKTIPAGMFSGCKYLESVAIPTTVEVIGNEAFRSCENLSSLTFAGQVETIGKEAFADCKKLTSVRISAKAIGERAFTSCNLTTVEIADGAKAIGPFAFSWNSGLASVSAPQTLEEIGSHAFQGYGEFQVGVYDTPFISNLPAEDGVKYIGSVAYLFMGGDEMRIKEGTLGVADDILTNHLYLYDGTNSWGSSSAFSGWTAPASVTLPSTLRVLGSNFGSPSITTLTLPESLVKIKGIDCENLKGSITIPASVEYFGGIRSKITRIYYNAVDANAVDAETKGLLPATLVRAFIGEGVKIIPDGLFFGCTNLARVQMPSTVEHIGYGAFDGCSSLTDIDLPAGLKEIGENAFYGAGLTTISAYMPTPATLENRFIESHTQIPLLKVPNGSLEAYQSDTWWSGQFQKIETFDGASDTEAINESTTITIGNTVTEDTDLSGTVVGGIFITLDTEESGDGYNASEGCIVINSQTTEDGIAAASANGANDLTVKNLLQGLVFEIPAGSGKITVDCQTLGSRLLFVKIGTDEPKKVQLGSRSTITFNYNVTEDTRVFIYAADENASAHETEKGDTPRRTAYANDNSVKFYGLSIEVDEVINGIHTANGNTALKPLVIYDLQGRRVSSPKGGLFIINGQKTVVK